MKIDSPKNIEMKSSPKQIIDTASAAYTKATTSIDKR